MPRKSSARKAKTRAKIKRKKALPPPVWKSPGVMVAVVIVATVAIIALINALTPAFLSAVTPTVVTVPGPTSEPTVQASLELPTPTPTEAATEVPGNVISLTFEGAVDANDWMIQACDDVFQDQGTLGEYRFLVPDDTSQELHECGIAFNGKLAPIKRVVATVRLDSGIGSASYVGIMATCGLVKAELLLDRFGVRPFVSGREGELVDDFGANAEGPLEAQLVIEWMGDLIRFSVADSAHAPAEYPCTEYPEVLSVGIRTLGYYGIDAAILDIEVSD